MNTPLHVAILAAGEGKRMHSDLPKVLHCLAGRPLLAHVLDSARALDASSLCVVHGHGGEQVRERFADANVAWARQDPPLGTAHALAQALPHFSSEGVTLVLYGDVALVRPSTLASVVERARSGALSLLTVTLDDPAAYGRIVRDGTGKVSAIVECKDATPEQRAIREINTGIMAAPTVAFRRWLAEIDNNNAASEYYLTDVVRLAVRQGFAIETTHPASVTETLGANSKRELAQLERVYQREAADALLEAGVTLADPARIDVRGPLRCGRDVRIDIDCILEGNVVLSDDVTINAHCVLKDVEVGEGTSIAPFSHVEDARLGARCRVGPFARVRPASVLGDEVHIGNFVEVKASSIGERSKANHLAYVGDATVGRDVNIGAGTITCNYDGANKHRTIIEDEVHIGSDTQLVAPVTVHRGATIAAGATITKDVPAGELTLSQNKQVTITGWQRPRKG